MALIDDYGDPNTDQGVWDEWGKDKESGKVVRLRIRAIPDDEERKIRAFVVGSLKEKVRILKLKAKDARDDAERHVREFDVDLERERLINVSRAKYALLDSENLTVKAKDGKAVELYSGFLGREVPLNEPFSLDGHWNDLVKEHLFGKVVALVDHVLEVAERLKTLGVEKEQELQGN